MEEVNIDKYRPKVREVDFVTRYLPGLLDTANPEGRRLWIQEIAKNIYLPVDVIDNNDHNKVLFTVPPYTRQVESKDTDFFSNAVSEFHITTKRFNESIASRTLAHRMQHVFVADPTPEEDRKTWRAILERYGLLSQTAVSVEVKHDPDLEEPDW
jgi:hypothetical protein